MIRTPKAIRLAAERAHALGDPTRLSVALILRDAYPAPVSVSEIAEEIGRDRSLVSRHCSKLRRAGFVSTGKATNRGCVMTRSAVPVVDAILRT
jgi:DNA-binding transcriptional ArsR family regulator